MRSKRNPAVVLAGLVIASVILAAPVAAARPGGGGSGPKFLSFGGYTWLVKSSSRKLGPGPNLFDPNGAWVDGTGLHLTIRKVGSRWYSSEVINQQSLGRGTYSWTVQGDLAALDQNAVLGLFTWNDDPAYNHREIDIEFARWSYAGDPTNGQYVVQPYSTEGNLMRTTQPAGVTSSTHAFTWKETSVDFASTSAAPTTWTYDGPDVPQPGGENARMNLWQFRGQAPSNGQPIEIIITDFTFTPLAP